MERRRFLGVVGAGSIGATAGCLEGLLEQHRETGPERGPEDGATPRTPAGLETTQSQVEISAERFDAASLAYDVTLAVDHDGASRVTATSRVIGSDETTTHRLTASGRHVLEGLRAGTELQFDATDGHIAAPIAYVVGTESGLTVSERKPTP